MALVLIEGFDHYATDDAEQKGWQIGAGLLSASGRQKFPPGQAAKIVINNGTGKQLPDSYDELIMGFAFYLSGMPGGIDGDTVMCKFHTALFTSVAQVGVTIGTNVLFIEDATHAQVAFGTTELQTDTWYYLEFHATDTSAEIHLDGVSEIAPTAGDYAAPWDEVSFSYQVLAGNKSMLVDDVYALDPTTGVNTDFLGPVVVRTLYPRNDATYTDFTQYPATPTDHFSHVNERFIDYDDTFVFDGTPGDKDSYKMPIYGTDLIFGAQLNLGARAGDAGPNEIEPLIRQSGSDYTGDTSSLGYDYFFYSWLLDQDPTGADWTPLTVWSDEFGMEIVT